ncbi:protein transport protein Sec16B [Echinops telfairi]|uniref:Protein transport protein Sec16B n=1 Tax=Echinops telfairi TaxID=9371 RepID=A0AC55DQ86_ECHTE|nr:protein transport protein Sec16B [Echinops telfairi]
MEPWVPQGPPQPQGKSTAPSKDSDRGLRRDEYNRPIPYSPHNGKRFYQWQDLRGSPQPQQDPRADPQQYQHPYRPEEWHQPVRGIDYYEGGYPRYSRPGYEIPYQGYRSPALREDYAYGSYYYHGHPQELPEERVPRPGSPYTWHEDYQEQKSLSEHPHESQNRAFGTNNESQFQYNSRDPYRDSPASNSGQERPGEVFPESLPPGAQKNKPSLASKSNLLQQHESGLSSSGYELSQYMKEASEHHDPMASAAWSPVQAEDASAAAPKAPMKFYVPHVPVCFGPGGQLVCVGLRSATHGQMTLVELHSMEVILGDSEEQEELRAFSGPLIREDIHKVDIMAFCQKKAAQSHKSEGPRSRDSALLWQLLVLLCRQNGSMVGSDIAELLMQDCKKLEKFKRQPPVANLINLTDEDWPVPSAGTPNLLTGEIPPSVETPAQIVEKFTKLLYYGRKKEALEWAMKNHLWGHAFFLSSKMDPRTYSWVMSRAFVFYKGTPNQRRKGGMAGSGHSILCCGLRFLGPHCCGDKQWGDWRPHLAVILSNQAGDSELHQRAIITMGDTLAGKGLVEAAHFCYLTAHTPFGYYTVKTDRLALLGSSHSQDFVKFAATEAIQRTEILEYCQMLGRPKAFIPSFQVYKLLYASRLADYGLTSQALHYCEAIGAALLSQGESSHPVLLGELIKLSEKLKLSDPLWLERRRRGDRDPEPDWLVKLRRQHQELEVKEPKAAEDIGQLYSAGPNTWGARGTAGTHPSERSLNTAGSQDLLAQENAYYQNPSGYPAYSEPLGYHSGQSQSNPQLPLPLQRGSYPLGGGPGQMGAPVPLYGVPETHPPGIGSGTAVTTAPGARAQEDALQAHPPPGESTVSQDPFQHLEDPKAPVAPRARTNSESSTASVKEAEVSSDEEDGTSPQNNAPREKAGSVKANAKSSRFGWFSWFRSKPSSASTSGDEDSGDSPDSEETRRASSPPQAGPSLSLMLPTGPQPLLGPSAFSPSTDSGEVQGSVPSGGPTEGTGVGGQQGLQGVSSEPYFNPGALLLPPILNGAVPLYNPSQVPQLSRTMGQSRPNRLAQRRYPTQP